MSVKAIAEAKQAHDAEAQASAEQEQSFVKIAWNELYAAKRRGVITDRGPIEAATTIVKGVALMCGIPVTVAADEDNSPQDNDHLPVFIWLKAVYVEQQEELANRELIRFAREAAQELRDAELVVPTWLATPIDKELPGVNVENPHLRDFYRTVAEKHDDKFVPAIMWPINVWVWEGPFAEPFERHVW